MDEKKAIRIYLIQYLSNPQIVHQDKQVTKMMILLLAKITKLGWFDDPEV